METRLGDGDYNKNAASLVNSSECPHMGGILIERSRPMPDFRADIFHCGGENTAVLDVDHSE